MKTDVQKVECQAKDEDRDTFPDFHDFEQIKTCLDNLIPEMKAFFSLYDQMEKSKILDNCQFARCTF